MTLTEFLDKTETDFLKNDDYWYRRVGGNWVVYDGNRVIHETPFALDMIQWLRIRKIRPEHRPICSSSRVTFPLLGENHDTCRVHEPSNVPTNNSDWTES